MRREKGFLAAVMLGCLLTVNARAADPTPSATKELEEFGQAQFFFNSGSFQIATRALDKFIKDYPRSEAASIAAYELASAYLLTDQPTEATKAFSLLVRDYPETAWGRLALKQHLTTKDICRIADELRNVSPVLVGELGVSHSYQRALKLYQTCLERKPAQGGQQNTDAPQAELLFKAEDCLVALGQVNDAAAARAMLEKTAPESAWQKLLTIKRGGPAVFKERMDELVRLGGVESEHITTFLTLAEASRAVLSGDDLAHCQYLEAYCRRARDDRKGSRQLLETVCAKYSESSWAALAAFELAETKFNEGDFAGAKAGYLELVKRYPESPRANLARTWAGWLDKGDENWKQAEKALDHILPQLTIAHMGLAVRLRNECKKNQHALVARLAYQDSSNFLLLLGYGPSGFSLVNDAEGTTYHFMGQGQAIRAKKKFPLDLPAFALNPSTEKDKSSFTFGWNFGSNPAGQSGGVKIPAGAAQDLIASGRSKLHLHVGTLDAGKPEERRVFELQTIDCLAKQPTTFLFELTPSGGLQQVIYLSYSETGRTDSVQSMWIADQFVFGGTLTKEQLTLKLPDGVQVKEQDEVNPFEVMSLFMKLFAELGKELFDMK